MSINATLFVQMIVFATLVWFTMKFVWPPIANALDERAEKIAHGLAAAEHAKIELSNAHKEVELKLAATKNESTTLLADAERRAQHLIDEAKARAIDFIERLPAGSRTSVLPLCGSRTVLSLDAYRTLEDARGAVSRIELVDRPGSLGSLAVALGSAGADILSLDVVERMSGYAIDDLVVAANEAIGK